MANNFQQFDTAGANMESDAAYASDSQRSGGAGIGSIFASVLGNKLFFQLSTFVKAFANMLDSKGYIPNDGSAIPATSVGTLQAILMNVLTNSDRPLIKNFFPNTHTGSTTLDQVLIISFPALNSTSVIRLTFDITSTIQSGPPIFKLTINGVSVFNAAVISLVVGDNNIVVTLTNRASVSSQWNTYTNITHVSAQNVPSQATSINTGSANTLLMFLQSANNSDSQTVQNALLEIL